MKEMQFFYFYLQEIIVTKLLLLVFHVNKDTNRIMYYCIIELLLF